MALVTRARTPRRQQVLESFGSVESVCAQVVPTCGLFVVTRGQWSMIDFLLALARQHGGASFSLWSWTVGEYAADICIPLFVEPLLHAGRLILHTGALRRNTALVGDFQARYGAYAVSHVATHAKIMRVATLDGLRVLMRGSMSLNVMARIEQCDITEGGEDYAMIEAVEASLPVVPVPISSVCGPGLKVWAR